MMIKKIITVILISGMGMAIFFYYSNLQIDACKGLKPGTNISEMKMLLGEPLTSTAKTGKTEYTFKSNLFAAGPIRATADSVTGRIIVLKCTEGGPPEWSIP